MKLHFRKIHAQGNDYLFFDFLDSALPNLDFSELSRKLSERHFGIGADGIVIIFRSQSVDATMRIFNADGSEAEMCGSALRSLGYYLYKKNGQINQKIQTQAGIREIEILLTNGEIIPKTEIGIPKFIRDQSIEIKGYTGYQVEVGNPHFVIFGKKRKTEEVVSIGKMIEYDKHFPNRTNVEFVEVIDKKTISLQFWERGSGLTLACGTGTVASFFAARKIGLVEDKVKVLVPGGTLEALFGNGKFYLIGKTDYVFSGDVEI